MKSSSLGILSYWALIFYMQYTDQQLVAQAMKVAGRAYAPNSRFQVLATFRGESETFRLSALLPCPCWGILERP
jgi:hypothetical protein